MTLIVNTSNGRTASIIRTSDGETFYRIGGIDYRPANKCRECWTVEGALCSNTRGGTVKPHPGRILNERGSESVHHS